VTNSEWWVSRVSSVADEIADALRAEQSALLDGIGEVVRPRFEAMVREAVAAVAEDVASGADLAGCFAAIVELSEAYSAVTELPYDIRSWHEAHPWDDLPPPVNVIRADAFDRRCVARARALVGGVLDRVQQARPDIPALMPLVEDLFTSFRKAAVRFEREVAPGYQVNRLALEAMLATPEYEAVRASGTVGDVYLSALATQVVAEELASRLGETFGEEQQRQADLEEVAHLCRTGAELDDIADLADERGISIEDADHAVTLAPALAERLAEALQQALSGGLKRAAQAVEDASAQRAHSRDQAGGGAGHVLLGSWLRTVHADALELCSRATGTPLPQLHAWAEGESSSSPAWWALDLIRLIRLTEIEPAQDE
jgi:hypothetical protein